MAQDQARDVNKAAAVMGAAAKMGTEGSTELSVMGRDILVTGNIEATVDLLIEGRVIGDVTCQTLVLGQDSSITGSIRAERVRVSGKVDGAIDAVELAIEASAHVKGEISYTRIRIANGGGIEGSFKQKPAPIVEETSDPKLKLVEPIKPLELPEAAPEIDAAPMGEPAVDLGKAKVAGKAVRYFE